MTLTLDWSEVQLAAMIGVQRRIKNRRHHTVDTAVGRKDFQPWDIDIEGACAEMACAKALGVYYSKGFVRQPDVGGWLQVRSTRHPNGRLLIQPRDHNIAPYLLVITNMPTYNIVGWMTAGEAKQHPEWIGASHTGIDCWWVPQNALHPIEELPNEP